MGTRVEDRLREKVIRLGREKEELQGRLDAKTKQVALLLDQLIELRRTVEAAGFDIVRGGDGGSI